MHSMNPVPTQLPEDSARRSGRGNRFGPASGVGGISCAGILPAVLPDHERRIQWWREAKFGMFVHWGLYSILGREAWAMGDEDIPLREYEQLAAVSASAERTPCLGEARPRSGHALHGDDHQAPRRLLPFRFEADRLLRSQARAWPRSGARVCGRCACRRPACRFLLFADGLASSGLANAKDDPAARKRFVDYTHGQLRELMSNYGKVDILWYDMPVPLDAAGWRSEEMNRHGSAAATGHRH